MPDTKSDEQDWSKLPDVVLKQVPPTAVSAGRFELFQPGGPPLLHAVITAPAVEDRTTIPEYRQAREHWFLSPQRSLTDWLNLDPLELHFKVAKVETKVSHVTEAWYGASSFQFRCRADLVASDWTEKPLPSLPMERTILLQGTWQNDDQTVRDVVIAVIVDPTATHIEKLTWFAKTPTPPPLFNGNPQEDDDVTLNRIGGLPKGFDYFYDEKICG